jgi:hypothetical protein
VGEALRETIPRGDLQQELDTVAVLDSCAVDPRFEHQPLRIHKQMALSALDLLGPVVATLSSSYPGSLDRLAIHYARAGLGVPLQADPHTLAQSGVHPLPGSIQAPETEVVVDGLPGREVVRQQSPGTAAPDDVEDGVEDLAQRIDPRAPIGFGCGKMGLQAAPFGIGEVGLVCFSHDARYPTERAPQNPFSDSFLTEFSEVRALLCAV